MSNGLNASTPTHPLMGGSRNRLCLLMDYAVSIHPGVCAPGYRLYPYTCNTPSRINIHRAVTLSASIHTRFGVCAPGYRLYPYTCNTPSRINIHRAVTLSASIHTRFGVCAPGYRLYPYTCNTPSRINIHRAVTLSASTHTRFGGPNANSLRAVTGRKDSNESLEVKPDKN
ncbi:hypothetical protein J6590_019683 [Homalodisca vitripennis]|nr:hypothetical protein J6590_019683 [Homalodisca vitripennis]